MATPASVGSSSSLKNLAEIRAMIKRHKMNDTLFAIIGLLALMLGLVTLLVLFTDLILDGSDRFNLEFLSSFPLTSCRACRPSVRLGGLLFGDDGDLYCRCPYGRSGWLIP